jgi:hypothetical protein
MTKVIQFKDNTFLNGTIYEEGSSANGNYIKFTNGILICWNEVTVNNLAINNQSAGLFCSSIISPFPNFPVAFKIRPSITVNSYCASQYGTFVQKCYPPGTTYVSDLRIYGTWSSTQNVTISYIAIGRWK